MSEYMEQLELYIQEKGYISDEDMKKIQKMASDGKLTSEEIDKISKRLSTKEKIKDILNTEIIPDEKIEAVQKKVADTVKQAAQTAAKGVDAVGRKVKSDKEKMAANQKKVADAVKNAVEKGADAVDKKIASDKEHYNKNRAALLGELEDAWKQLKSCHGLTDKVTIDELKHSRKEVQSAIATFQNVVKKFYSKYKKIPMHAPVTESVVELNQEVRRLLSDSDREATKIRNDKTMSKEDKATALKAVVKAKADGVRIALKALEEGYRAFVSAVKSDDKKMSQEYKILMVQLKLFTQQYEALTGYVIDNAPFLALVGLTICVGTAAVSASHVAAAGAVTAISASGDAMKESIKLWKAIDIDYKQLELKCTELQRQYGDRGRVMSAIISTPQLAKFAEHYAEMIAYYNNSVSEKNEELTNFIANEMLKRNFISRLADAGTVSATAAIANSLIKKKRGYNPLSFTHKEDVLSKATNRAAMNKSEKKIKKLSGKKL